MPAASFPPGRAGGASAAVRRHARVVTSARRSRRTLAMRLVPPRHRAERHRHERIRRVRVDLERQAVLQLREPVPGAGIEARDDAQQPLPIGEVITGSKPWRVGATGAEQDTR